ALLTLSIALTRRTSAIPVAVLASTIAGSFMALWTQQNWQLYGNPLAFAQRTEENKLAEHPANVESGLWERLIYFPEHALSAAPGIVIAGLIATAVLLYARRDRWWPVLALIWGQAF